MDICFEFGCSDDVARVPWEKLLADYNIFAGQLWMPVLLTTLCGPRLIFAVVPRQEKAQGERLSRAPVYATTRFF